MRRSRLGNFRGGKNGGNSDVNDDDASTETRYVEQGLLITCSMANVIGLIMSVITLYKITFNS